MNSQFLNTTRLVTVEEMRQMDRLATRDFFIPSLLLMEYAGFGITEMVVQRIKSDIPVLIMCGKGQNGGDGLVAARLLSQKKFKVTVFLLNDPSEFQDEALLNYGMISKMPIPVIRLQDESSLSILGHYLKTETLILDAIYGTGLNRAIDGICRKTIELVNQSHQTVIALDIPSGINGNTGEVLGAAICATQTGTFGFIKQGLMRNDALTHTGDIRVIDIGLPREFYDKKL